MSGQLIAVVAVALFFDLLNGFHDGCNAVSTVIYTGALKPRVAIALSAVFNFVGPLVMGVAVAKTIGGVIDAGDASAHLVIAALLGACVWEILTWLWALPVSSSHALVGGLLGAGVAALGADGINWEQGHPRVCRAAHLTVPGDHHRLSCSCGSAGSSSPRCGWTWPGPIASTGTCRSSPRVGSRSATGPTTPPRSWVSS